MLEKQEADRLRKRWLALEPKIPYMNETQAKDLANQLITAISVLYDSFLEQDTPEDNVESINWSGV